MNIFGFETVDSLPALYHPELDLLAISDIHLGLEGTLTSEGSYIPQFQLDELLGDIDEAKEETGASRVLVNGDLKHEFSGTSHSERKEIRELLDFLKDRFEDVIIVKGNHDTFVDSIAEDAGVDIEDKHLEDGVLFSHGHKTLETAFDYETLVIGHEHPALELKDEVGVKEKVDCFLYGEQENGRNIIVMPAFSKISGGSRINQVPQEELLSPVLRNSVDMDSMKAVAVSREAGLFKFPEIGKL
ncbi:MAG: metallophosphoesterase [Candidatus Nanohaloarchaea archaeon]